MDELSKGNPVSTEQRTDEPPFGAKRETPVFTGPHRRINQEICDIRIKYAMVVAAILLFILATYLYR